jgi:hypothetical protein
MSYFKVILSGRGIDLPFEGDLAVGFFTTRQVRAADRLDAESLAKDLVLAEWRSGGTYAQSNRGSLPVLSVEQSLPVGWLVGTFGRNPSGYTFYCHED